MDSFDEFREELRHALLHLCDPHFRAGDNLCEAVGLDAGTGCGPLQARILASIEDMRPSASVPVHSRARRDFDALHKRFVLGLAQEETAEQLHMSVRNVQRVQAEATHRLALLLWSRWREGLAVTESSSRAEDWHSQMDKELASLSASAPNAVADVGNAIHGVLELEEALVASSDVRVKVAFVRPDLVAAVHPSVLRQTLITAIRRLGQHVSPGPVEIYATLEDGMVKITLTGQAASGHRPSGDDLVRDVIAPLGASVEAHWRGSRVFLQARLPTVGRRTVLVVEDNLDMVHFFRRCTAGTAYRVVHAAPDRGVIETIEAAAPDVVVLDVMLPEVDGWQLLNHLHERPATRSIPVIVCSVVREERLALALGAAAFLHKPVQPRRFVEALDRVVHRGRGEASRAQAKNAVA